MDSKEHASSLFFPSSDEDVPYESGGRLARNLRKVRERRARNGDQKPEIDQGIDHTLPRRAFLNSTAVVAVKTFETNKLQAAQKLSKALQTRTTATKAPTLTSRS